MKMTKEDIARSLSKEQAKALGLSQTTVIRAGAGAGKTTTLVAALLYDLLVSEIPAEKIAVATFTRSAAAGLRSRLEESLWRMFEDKAPDISGLWLGTIDALALRYLKMFALRENISPSIAPARKRDLLRLSRKAFAMVLEEKESRELLRAFGGEDELYKSFLSFELYLESKGIDHFSVFARDVPAKEPVVSALFELSQSGVGEKSVQMIEKDILLIEKNQPEKMKAETKWNIRKESPRFLQALALRDEWREASLDAKVLPRKEEAEEIFRDWQFEYQRLRHAEGLFSYSDILQKTLAIAKPRFQRIYIDEAQDTSVLQRKMLEALSSGEMIFIGDKNQSIYHFRGADTNLWEKESEGLDEVVLHDNYRSGAEILAFTEKACKPLLGDDLIKMQAQRKGGSVDVLLTVKQKDEDGALSEARGLLPGVFEKIKEEGFEFSDVAILLPSNNDINAYYKALRELGIPALALRARGLLREEECQDMKAYLRFLFARDDEEALLRLLSSPFFSFTKEELWRLTQKSRDLERPLFECLADDEQKILQESLRLCGKERPSQILRQAMRRHNFDLALDLLDPTGVMHDNVEGFLGVVSEIEEEGSDLLSVLQTLDLEEEADDDGQDKDLPRGRKAVRLLTIHRAKGDEFPVVILGRCARKKLNASNRLLVHDGGLGLSLPEGLRDSYASEALARETDLLRAESNRLFYVGITRAEERLFLLASLAKEGAKPGSPLFEAMSGSFPVQMIAREEDDLTQEEIVLLDAEKITVGDNLYQNKRIPAAISWSKLASWKECSLRRDLELLSFPSPAEEGGSGKRLLGDRMHKLLARDVLLGEIRIKDYPKEGQEMIEKLSKSSIWQEIREYPQETEVSFTLQVANIPLRGRIDLLLWEKDGAWVLDWKSGEDDHFDELYLLQRKIYALALLLREEIDFVRATTYYLKGEKREEEVYDDKESLTLEVMHEVQEILKRKAYPASDTEKPFCAGCPGLLQVCPVSRANP